MPDNAAAKRQKELRKRRADEGVSDIRVPATKKMKERFNKIEGTNNTERLEWLLKKAKK